MLEDREKDIIKRHIHLLTPKMISDIARCAGVQRRTVLRYLDGVHVYQLANKVRGEKILYFTKIELINLCCQLHEFGNYYKEEINNISRHTESNAVAHQFN